MNKKTESILGWAAVAAVGIFLFNRSRNKRNDNGTSSADGDWGIAYCQRREGCADLCRERGGEFLPDTGNYGGCWCSGCQNQTIGSKNIRRPSRTATH